MGIFKQIFVLLISLLLSVSIFAQEFQYRIYFSDKHGIQRTAEDQYLSEKSLERRSRHGVVSDSSDLPINPNYIAHITTLDNVRYITKSKWFNRVVVGISDTSINSKIRNLAFVDRMEKIPGMGVKSDLARQDPFLSDTMTVSFVENTDDQLNSHQNEMINIDFLHDRGYLGDGVMVAVIDAGFSESDRMESLQHMFVYKKVIDYYDFVDNDKNVFHGSVHGTFVWSVMAGMIDGEYTGIAPEADYLLLRSEDGSSETIIEEDFWIAAAEFADSAGADILNTSLGYTQFDDSLQDHSYEDLDGETTIITIGAQLAAKKGILVVNSAGNLGAADWHFVSPPADGADVLTVGSVDLEGNVSGFSSRGPSADGRLKPNVVSPGQGVSIINTQDEVVSGSGTSFSSPILAAGAACLLQSFPQSTNDELFHVIERSSDQFLNPNNDHGYGIPNFGIAYLLLSSERQVTSEDDLQVFPNPFESNFTIYINSYQQQDVRIRMMDVTGKLIHEQTELMHIGEKRLVEISDLSNSLGKGIYFLEINVNEDSIVKKLIKT